MILLCNSLLGDEDASSLGFVIWLATWFLTVRGPAFRNPFLTFALLPYWPRRGPVAAASIGFLGMILTGGPPVAGRKKLTVLMCLELALVILLWDGDSCDSCRLMSYEFFKAEPPRAS